MSFKKRRIIGGKRMNIPTDPEYKEIIRALKPFLDVKGQRAADDVLGTMNLIKIIESLKMAIAESSYAGKSMNPTDILAMLAELDVNEDVVRSVVSAISSHKNSAPPKRDGNGAELFNQFLSNLKTQDPKEAVGSLLSSLKESGVNVEPLQNLAKSLSSQSMGCSQASADEVGTSDVKGTCLAEKDADVSDASESTEDVVVYWERDRRDRDRKDDRDRRDREGRDDRDRRDRDDKDEREEKDRRESRSRRRSKEDKDRDSRDDD